MHPHMYLLYRYDIVTIFTQWGLWKLQKNISFTTVLVLENMID